MKNLFLLGLLLSSSLIFSQEKGEVIKNNQSVVDVTKHEGTVELAFTPTSYNRKDVEFHEIQKITLTTDQYAKFVIDLKSGLEDKKDVSASYGSIDIRFDYENGGTIYSKTKLGTSFLNFKPKIRFGIEGSEETSIYLTQNDIKKLLI